MLGSCQTVCLYLGDRHCYLLPVGVIFGCGSEPFTLRQWQKHFAMQVVWKGCVGVLHYSLYSGYIHCPVVRDKQSYAVGMRVLESLHVDEKATAAWKEAGD